MTFDSDRIDTIFVDSYGTLVNELSTRKALEKYTDRPDTISRIWDLRGSIYGISSAVLDDFRPTWERYKVSLDYALDAVDADVTDEEKQKILDSVGDLEVYDDVRPGLERLTGSGYDVYMLSNGDPEMLDQLVEHADIDDLLSDKISAADAGVCKPDRRLYRHAASVAETAVSNAALVAGSWYDIQGALHTGMNGVWINRGHNSWEEILDEPDLKIQSFHDLADALDAPDSNQLVS